MVKVAQQWTEHEFAGLDLGDARLDRRAKKLIERLAESPAASIPEACDSWSGSGRHWWPRLEGSESGPSHLSEIEAEQRKLRGVNFRPIGATHSRRNGATFDCDFRGSNWAARMRDFVRFCNGKFMAKTALQSSINFSSKT